MLNIWGMGWHYRCPGFIVPFETKAQQSKEQHALKHAFTPIRLKSRLVNGDEVLSSALGRCTRPVHVHFYIIRWPQSDSEAGILHTTNIVSRDGVKELRTILPGVILNDTVHVRSWGKPVKLMAAIMSKPGHFYAYMNHTRQLGDGVEKGWWKYDDLIFPQMARVH